jgi:hypothetical protein
MVNKAIDSHRDRNKWLICEDAQLLKECIFTEFQSSGPGGQKRNRKYSSVRLSHKPSGIEVTAVETRSQNSNKKIALKKLRCLIAMNIRSAKLPQLETLKISLRNSQYPCLLALIFDTLHNVQFSVRDAGEALGISTGQLIKLLLRDNDAWQKINTERQKRNMSILHK